MDEDQRAAHQEALGDAIIATRKKLRPTVSQEEFAHRSGLHRNYIGRVERGELNVSLINIVRIAHHLDTTLPKLFAEYERQLAVPPRPDKPKKPRKSQKSGKSKKAKKPSA